VINKIVPEKENMNSLFELTYVYPRNCFLFWLQV